MKRLLDLAFHRRRTSDGFRTPLVLPAIEAYDRWAGGYSERMNPVQDLEEDALLRALPALTGKMLLDVGCGTGRIVRMALERGASTVTGVDASPVMIDRAAKRTTGPARWIVGDACRLSVEDASVDVVVSAMMLGHVQRLDEAIGEMDRVLKAPGYAVISDFHPFATLRGDVRSFVDPIDRRTYAAAQHLHLFEDYFRCFHAIGWSIEFFEEPLLEGFPVVFAVRVRKG